MEFIDKKPSYFNLIPSFYPNYYPGLLRFWNLYFAGGESINACDLKGNTPLHAYLAALAPCNNYEGICYHVDYLKQYFGREHEEKVDWCARNDEGENALHVIAREEYARDGAYAAKLFGALVRKGVHSLEEDGKGRSALDVAAGYGRKGILELFVVGK